MKSETYEYVGPIYMKIDGKSVPVPEVLTQEEVIPLLRLDKLHAEAPVGVPYVLIDRKRYEKILDKWQEYQEQGKVWTNKQMMNNALRDFRIHAKRAGIIPNGQMTVHCLRKSCGQNWANHLPIHVTMKLMGHSSVTTTQMFYSQVEQYHHDQAAKVIQALVGGEENELIE